MHREPPYADIVAQLKCKGKRGGAMAHISVEPYRVASTLNLSITRRAPIPRISPGLRPIGVLDPLQGCVWNVPRPRKVGAPGPSAAEVGSLRSGWIPANLPGSHGGL